jgi:SAM-dependent methyltransferase
VSDATGARGPRAIVAAGYDALGARYLDWSREIRGDPRGRFVDELVARLPDRARILDLGCGPGVPSTRRLTEHGHVVAVDVSEAQLRLAREAVPGAALVRADLAEVAFRPSSFDAVVSLYAISHVPREAHRDVFVAAARWRRPGGLLLAPLATGDSPAWRGEWLGVEMHFSSHPPPTTHDLVTRSGLELLADEVVTMREPAGEASFLWLLARRRQSSSIPGGSRQT